MKGKIKVFFADVPDLIKLKPIIFVTMVYSLIYGLAASIISTVQLSFYIGITGSYSIILGISKWFGLKNYNRINGLERTDEIIKLEKRAANNIAICASIMTFLHFSFVIVSTFFYEENPSHYTLWILLFTAGAAFVKIVLNTVQAIRTRKNHSLIIHHIKLADTANSLIALALTQRAILYYVGEQYAKLASGLGGVFFSSIAGVICFSMINKYIKDKQK